MGEGRGEPATSKTAPEIVTAGHICLDMFPYLGGLPDGALEAPGRLYEVGQLRVTTGGLVANTGVAMHLLGANVRLLATVGSDLVGESTIEALRRVSPDLTTYLGIRKDCASSYTIVLARPGQDRLFLHCTGPNEQFAEADIDFSLVEGARWFHFGYPPVLPRMFENGGKQLARVLMRAHQQGAVTSLDFTLPDPATPSGQADWPQILKAALPWVDVFVPSLEEAIYLLRRVQYMRWSGNVAAHVSRDLLIELAHELLDMGPAIVGFKLGEDGVLLVGGARERLLRMETRLPAILQWVDQQIEQPAYQVSVVGTTGAGDAAYAGLIVGMLNGLDPRSCARAFAAAGAASVESPDGLRGLKPSLELAARFGADWPKRTYRLLDK